MNKKLVAVAVGSVVSMGVIFSGSALAAKPHSTNGSEGIVIEDCTCDNWTPVDTNSPLDGIPDVWEGECDVTWYAGDGISSLWTTWGLDLELSWEYTMDAGATEVEGDADAEIDTESALCGTDPALGGDPTVDDEYCEVTNAVVQFPPYGIGADPDSVEPEFEARVKGFQNGKGGPTSRDFVKGTGACAELPPEGDFPPA
jgi:hypothetical protein